MCGLVSHPSFTRACGPSDVPAPALPRGSPAHPRHSRSVSHRFRCTTSQSHPFSPTVSTWASPNSSAANPSANASRTRAGPFNSHQIVPSVAHDSLTQVPLRVQGARGPERQIGIVLEQLPQLLPRASRAGLKLVQATIQRNKCRRMQLPDPVFLQKFQVPGIVVVLVGIINHRKLTVARSDLRQGVDSDLIPDRRVRPWPDVRYEFGDSLTSLADPSFVPLILQRQFVVGQQSRMLQKLASLFLPA